MTFDLWFLLILLGLMTYSIVQRSVANITRTPVWILWLVMMTPAFSWVAWILIYGDRSMPLLLLLGLCIGCPILYGWLVQKGRINTNPPPNDTSGENININNTFQPSIEPNSVCPIDKDEEPLLKECFAWTVYALHELEYRPQAVICRGQLRSEPGLAYQTIRKNIENKFGDRFLVVFEESLTNNKPFFIIVPNPFRNIQAEPFKPPLVALALLLITIFTTTVFGTKIADISPQNLQANAALLWQGLPYSLGIVVILAVHELGHYFTAKLYQISTALPYFIPLPPPFLVGTLGAFTQMRSPIPHRKALFDISITGPIVGFIATIPLLIWGLSHSTIVDLTDNSGLLNFNSLNPRFSFLFTLISKLVMGNALIANKAIDLHPIAVAGYLGLILTALNLMPVGPLDGGRIVHAMYGRWKGAAIGQIARLLLLVMSIIQLPKNPELFIWAIFLFLIPVIDEPALNDVSELDNYRDLWGLLTIALLILIILPTPNSVINWLNL